MHNSRLHVLDIFVVFISIGLHGVHEQMSVAVVNLLLDKFTNMGEHVCGSSLQTLTFHLYIFSSHLLYILLINENIRFTVLAGIQPYTTGLHNQNFVCTLRTFIS